MRFVSTRGQASTDSFREVVARGLAPDGGLYLPESLPDLRPHLAEWSRLGYADLCSAFLRLFATDIDPDRLDALVQRSYQHFEDPEVAPVRALDDRLFVLELFSGPTLAFKDYALQLLGNLYGLQVEETGRPLNVLGATSGDTGAAAIHGLAPVPGVHTFILYPRGRISALQERQMTATGNPRVFPLAIEGSFDDAQRELKKLFGDDALRRKLSLSAVNSINLARILAQSVYYLYAWFRLPEDVREDLEVVVPTGNFGNVFAGWLLSRMGLPLRRFRVATNRNDILCRFFQSGFYQVGEVEPSLAPSMDIQVASNFERLLYYLLDQDGEAVRKGMERIRQEGRLQVDVLRLDDFRASRAEDGEILRLIEDVHLRYGYLCDPHTATAFKDLSSRRPSLVLSTAHPAKFPETIGNAVDRHPTHPSLEALKARPITFFRIQPEAGAIADFIAAHSAVLPEG